MLIDDGCTVEGYQSDISRTFVLGKATDKMKQVFDIVHRRKARPWRRPARACRARRWMRPPARSSWMRAMDPAYKYFTHRVGHGLGMDGHEWPYLRRQHPARRRHASR